MPELPEVETIVRDLRKKIIGRKIESAWFDSPFQVSCEEIWEGKSRFVKAPKLSEFSKQIKGLKIIDVQRRAKNILIYFSADKMLLIHQKMTGHLLYGKWSMMDGKLKSSLSGAMQDRVNDFIHFILYFENGWQLALSDMRKFAKVIFASKESIENLKEIKELGPEPLEKNFDFKKFEKIIGNKAGKIKQILMDPYVIAGIGNIYSDDILWEAQIHPFRSAKSLDKKELKKIFLAIKKILTQAVKLRGTSISDYRDVEGKKGYYVEKRRVYRREGEKCFRCKSEIKRVKMGGRSAHFCPKCQKLS
ncbi:MAG TPA: bifunctional DNA-formamidopyrimidine glycosylase/DNA-(apurinic or apyrimidinic site) lyase [Candidatus Paceibacterota bacterium]|nr:bifunctional DNA-formamidopyrimidine glycosylase/DNA-(apurinic or apyrimidinic site) lyase [Candidatus Paceibacterota bacterium]HPT40135.1 bifunctional DNA-formamidopyrimidine glycosylase/DNA-(apurinic or apyrimidinic site) lyase [Candidatus Paceibacterota bacterium]